MQKLSVLLFSALLVFASGCRKTAQLEGLFGAFDDLGESFADIGVNDPLGSDGGDLDVAGDAAAMLDADTATDVGSDAEVTPDVEPDLGPPPCEWQIVQSVENPRGSGFFGATMAASETVAVVSNSTGIFDPDEVYVFELGTDQRWSLSQTLLPVDGGEDLAGALLLDDDLLVVGGATSQDVTVYQRQAGAFAGVQRVVGPPDALDFGRALARTASGFLVGAARDSENGLNSGAVYQVTGSGASWQSPIRTDVESVAGQFVGRALDAIDGRVAVGGSGSAAVYNFNGDALTASPLAAEHEEFGSSLEVTDETLFVGAPGGLSGGGFGQVIVFGREGESYVRETAIEPPEPVSRLSFGASIASDGDRVAVGASTLNDQRGGDMAFLYERDENSEWMEVARFDPELGENVASSFGVQVALAGEFVLITDAHAPNSVGTGWLHVAACE